MTKKEISTFFGWKDITIMSKLFKKAGEQCQSIKEKEGHYTKNYSVDYTLEETLLALSLIDQIDCWANMTPMMIRLLIENFKHRDTAYALKTKKQKLSRSASRFIWYFWRKNGNVRSCVVCRYFEARTPNLAGAKPKPYCNFYECFLHKVKPKRDIYYDRCPTFLRKWGVHPLIFTKDGNVYPIERFRNDFSLKPSTSVFGISQDKFKSKRKRDEPITLLSNPYED